MKNPRVTIGIPVFNGERYLAQAIESILNQTYTDFELIISDNASTDDTQEICEKYAAADERIRYYRNDQNLGAAPNFNRLFDLARGEYFQWLAHDDLLAPDFLRQCVEILDADPSSILCFSWVNLVDERGQQNSTCELQLRIDDPRPQVRFRDILLEWHNSFYVFGLLRSAALRKTKLILPLAHGDTILIARLGLLGPFRQIPEHLFLSRYHPAQSNQVYQAALPRGFDLVAYSVWFDPRAVERIHYPYWRVMAEYFRTLAGVRLGWLERLSCYLSLAHLFLRHRKGLWHDLKSLPRRLSFVVSPLTKNEYEYDTSAPADSME